MAVVGIGIDLVRISRIKKMMERWNGRFLDRVFSSREKAYCLQMHLPYIHLSGRFAIKEAVMKALGTGLRSGIRWKEIETLRGPSGQPQVRLLGTAYKKAAGLGVAEIFCSISHDVDYAVGQVVLEGSPKP
ncbi:MAG: holo-ACP synthase [Nitrospiria bacterium]